MNISFESYQIKGRGRARKLGYPTINLEIPKNFELEFGVYGVIFSVDLKDYLGAMHYGPSPTFADTEKTLEVYLIDLKNKIVPESKNKTLKIKVLKYLREILNFIEKNDLIKQIDEDIKEIKNIKI